MIWEDIYNEYDYDDMLNRLNHEQDKGFTHKNLDNLIPNKPGQYNSSNKLKYHGEFLNGQYHGKGKLIFADNCKLVGKFNNGKLIPGTGIFYLLMV